MLWCLVVGVRPGLNWVAEGTNYFEAIPPRCLKEWVSSPLR